MTDPYKILFILSTFSNFLPIISLMYLYNKLDKAFRIYLLVLIIGSSIDLLGYAKRMLGFHFNYMLIVDFYEIINYGLILYFFFLINNKKKCEQFLNSIFYRYDISKH